jgi:hypothetical protein
VALLLLLLLLRLWLLLLPLPALRLPYQCSAVSLWRQDRLMRWHALQTQNHTATISQLQQHQSRESVHVLQDSSITPSTQPHHIMAPLAAHLCWSQSG